MTRDPNDRWTRGLPLVTIRYMTDRSAHDAGLPAAADDQRVRWEDCGELPAMGWCNGHRKCDFRMKIRMVFAFRSVSLPG